ncbi:MAG: NAD(P)/FAD-dependent oxidoreductase [Pseudomonadota bacterium]
MTDFATIETDCLIVGAGPCGLFQVFELGLLGLKAHLVDALRAPGGQCTELYPDKPIYDIPALPVVGAQELIDRLMEQIDPFEPTFHLGQEVQEVQPLADGEQGFHVRTSAGTTFRAKTVIIAGGVGSFQPRKLRAEGADRFEGRQIHYKVSQPEQFAGKHLVVCGGGDSALDWTLELRERAASMTLIHRRDEYRAQPASVAKMQAHCEAGEMRSLIGSVTALRETDDQLTGLEVRDLEGATHEVAADQVLVFWGLRPALGPIANWGLNLHRNTIPVDTEKFQTSTPGIFAVGDINQYPGKKKLILSGFHEAALAAFAVKALVAPDEKVRLQYTTTSPLMQERLGVRQ